MGEVKSVKMDNWTATDTNTLFADGKLMTDHFLRLFHSICLFRRGACTMFSRAAYL